MLSIIPLPYRLLAIGLAFLACIAFGWIKGNDHGSAKLTEYIGKEATEAVRIAQGRATVSTQVVTHYVQQKAKTEVATANVIKEVNNYAATNPTSNCLDAEWGRVFNASALNHPVSDTPGGPDDPGGAPTAAEALGACTASNAVANRNADHIDALEAWIAAQVKVR